MKIKIVCPEKKRHKRQKQLAANDCTLHFWIELKDN